MFRSTAPGSSPVLCRNDVVDVGYPDVVQGDIFSRQLAEEVVSGSAVGLYGRRGEAALLAQPFFEDRDLCAVQMALVFRLVEPSEEAQPLYCVTDKVRFRLGRSCSSISMTSWQGPECCRGFYLGNADTVAISQIQ
jgi:hypothetical protein